MQKVAATNLQPGMVLARNIFSIDGVLLLSAGTLLTPPQIDRLQQFNLTSVYIKNPLADTIEDSDIFETIPEIVREETRVQAVQIVHSAFENFATSQELDTQQFKETADFIIDEVIKNRGAMIHLTDIRALDGYTFGHSVNVCVLATFTGMKLGYNLLQLKELSLGALLHDTGKLFIPHKILNKPGPLTANERKIMEQHAEFGFDILRRQSDIPLVSAHIALQHHEKYDGTGYARHLSGDNIHEYARIVAIADVYDAITSDRPYKEGTLPHEAYELMLSLSNTHFDPRILKIFLDQIAIYPLDSVVKINTGEIALVIKVTPGLQTRPTLKILFDAKGKWVANGPEVDLTKHLTVFIDKIFTPTEVLELEMRQSRQTN